MTYQDAIRDRLDAVETLKTDRLRAVGCLTRAGLPSAIVDLEFLWKAYHDKKENS